MRPRLAAAAVLLVAAACSSAQGAANADQDAPAVLVDAFPGDVPNPFVLVDGDRFVMYATEGSGYFTETLHVPVRVSTDLRTWEIVGDAMPDPPAWVTTGSTWAPDVAKVEDRYVMWFTARVAGREPATQCIGRAVASDPLGPFVAEPAPVVCQLDRGGSIDPRSFRAADGSRWLHWKSDDNADVDGTSRSSIYARRLADDGLSFVGEAVRILEADQRWEGRIVEAPDMQTGPDGRMWLFYSGNWFNQPVYALGVAQCDGPAGPCRKLSSDRPWLATNGQGAGPGEASLFTDPKGVTWIVYAPRAQAYRSWTPRPVALGRVAFGPGGPYLTPPGDVGR